jgi:hypothetical protein
MTMPHVRRTGARFRGPLISAEELEVRMTGQPADLAAELAAIDAAADPFVRWFASTAVEQERDARDPARSAAWRAKAHAEALFGIANARAGRPR